MKKARAGISFLAGHLLQLTGSAAEARHRWLPRPAAPANPAT